ncbi:hypothetical protein [Saccharibacillus qingshengii]|uniref:hypothetical protein n=1 Tax=Saccharibacillus qingshengii TaxID=1763540 RepID=UPI0015544D5C|nr:hypothetical protein [Saccharibacillus qingshengii]
MSGKKAFYAIGVAIFIAVYAGLFYNQAGLRPMLIVCGSMAGGMVLWLKTTFRTPVDPSRLLPVYLLTLSLSLFFLHITEEFITDFSGSINTIFGSNWTLSDFSLLIVLLGPVIWISGAVGLYYRNPVGYYLAWFVFFGMLIGEPTHYLVFPIVQGGGYTYFSGMWTALRLWISPLLLLVKIRNVLKGKAHSINKPLPAIHFLTLQKRTALYTEPSFACAAVSYSTFSRKLIVRSCFGLPNTSSGVPSSTM